MKFLYILAMVFLLSCSKQDEKQVCGQETIAEYTIHNYSEFVKFQNRITVGDAEYFSNYRFLSFSNFPFDTSYWGVEVKLNNICNSDIPNIEFEVLLHNPDSTIIPLISIWESVNTDSTIQLKTLDNLYFRKSFDHDFKSDFGGKAATLYAFIDFDFPSKGSFSADSAYFFSNLDYMSCKISAHKPK